MTAPAPAEALPLNVRVWEALGHKVFQIEGDAAALWYYIPGNKPRRTHMAGVCVVPRLDSDPATVGPLLEALAARGLEVMLCNERPGVWTATFWKDHNTYDIQNEADGPTPSAALAQAAAAALGVA